MFSPILRDILLTTLLGKGSHIADTQNPMADVHDFKWRRLKTENRI